METECTYIEGCPMFKYFRRFMKKVYMTMYCQGYYQDCARRELRMSGKEVPDVMLPNGNMLFEDEREAYQQTKKE